MKLLVLMIITMMLAGCCTYSLDPRSFRGDDWWGIEPTPLFDGKAKKNK